MNTLCNKVERLMRKYPLYSQEKTSENDKIIVVRLFALASNATWWLTEYDPSQKIAF